MTPTSLLRTRCGGASISCQRNLLGPINTTSSIEKNSTPQIQIHNSSSQSENSLISPTYSIPSISTQNAILNAISKCADMPFVPKDLYAMNVHIHISPPHSHKPKPYPKTLTHHGHHLTLHQPPRPNNRRRRDHQHRTPPPPTPHPHPSTTRPRTRPNIKLTLRQPQPRLIRIRSRAIHSPIPAKPLETLRACFGNRLGSAFEAARDDGAADAGGPVAVDGGVAHGGDVVAVGDDGVAVGVVAVGRGEVSGCLEVVQRRGG